MASLVQLWYNRFKKGQEDVNDDARPGCPSTSTIEENVKAVKKKILDNGRITIREVADDAGISFGCFRHETCGSEDCFKITTF